MIAARATRWCSSLVLMACALSGCETTALVIVAYGDVPGVDRVLISVTRTDDTTRTPALAHSHSRHPGV